MKFAHGNIAKCIDFHICAALALAKRAITDPRVKSRHTTRGIIRWVDVDLKYAFEESKNGQLRICDVFYRLPWLIRLIDEA